MADEKGSMLFRFVQINDMHVYAESLGKNPYYSTMDNERVRWLVNAINEERFFPLPDFVLGLGDLIDGETIAHLNEDFKVLLQILHPMRCPLYPCFGNHEVMQNEGDPEFERAYRSIFGDERVNYTFEHKGIRFIVCSNGGAGYADRHVSQARNAWLKKVLEDSKDQPKIVCFHIPLVPLRDEAVLEASFGFPSYMDRDPEAIRLIYAHAGTIIAVLSGHLHLTGMVRRNDVAHIVVAGTGSYPCDYGVYTVYEDRIEVEVRQLPTCRPESNIHGRPRHAKDYTDSTHRTLEEYVRGLPQERKFTLELPPGKRPKK